MNQANKSKGNRLFKDFRSPKIDGSEESAINKLKNEFILLITNEFLEINKPFELTNDLKSILKFSFNWIIGTDIDWRDNKGIQFSGNKGLGKSCILSAIHKLTHQLYPTVSNKYITANKLARQFKYSDDNSEILINQLISCRLLFIDDIGTEDYKVYDSFPVQEIIRERYDRKRITSFTTNLSPVELADRYTASIEDKLNHGTYRIEFKGDSKR